jgi:hypothetical protein
MSMVAAGRAAARLDGNHPKDERRQVMKWLATVAKATILLALVAVPGLAGPVGAGGLIPFRGTLAGDSTISPVVPPIDDLELLFVVASGTGSATRLGAFTFVAPHLVIPGPSGGHATGFFSFTFGSGTLSADFVGQSSLTDDPVVHQIVETASITGGTGRFAGATGRFLVRRSINLVTGETSGSFSGFIFSHD